MGKPKRMTEVDWLTCTDPVPMLKSLRHEPSERKYRLFACACCRRIWHLLTDERSRKVIEVAERFTDGEVSAKHFRSVLNAANRMKSVRGNPLITEDAAAMAALGVGLMEPLKPEPTTVPNAVQVRGLEAANRAYEPAFKRAKQAGLKGDAAVDAAEAAAYEALERGEAEERAVQAALLRDLLGNPVRPVKAESSWRTPAVLGVARAIHNERRFEDMPILADALEDAGCDNADILDHCRGPGPHVLGCWLLDLLLGKG